jgi:hypothetical protein
MKITFADNISLNVPREHPGNEQKLIGLHSGHVGVLPHGFSEIGGIIDINIRGH